MAKPYLHQFLSKTGVFSSKKEILDSIHKGQIKIDDKIVISPRYQVKRHKKVTWRNKEINVLKDKIYVLMNKPKGYLSTRLSENDKKLGKKSMFSLIKDIDDRLKQSLFNIGRLDEDTSGLIILTNDGKLSNLIARPESEIEKKYFVSLKDELSDSNKEKIEKGIKIELEENWKKIPYITKPCKIEIKDRRNILITLSEGKKREIKRIFEAVNNKVQELRRVSIGKINLDELNIKEGCYEQVSKEFILKKIG